MKSAADSSLVAEPRLAPPGAGLPTPELWVARALFGWHRLRRSRAARTADLERERDRVLALVRPLSGERAARRVLIARLPGLEDSSRFWSPWMTLEHCRIVQVAIAGVIRSLGRGRPHDVVSSTATVKPGDAVGPETVGGFERSCESVLLRARQVPDLRTPVRHAHPWFGPLDAAAWYALAGFHLRLHRQQIERILAQP